ncbi:putative abi-domain-containing protein [Diaporthe ampelina]|uniref:intramembrane prenyl-peptidase Rce1 n=1 Tax=Diaporthe ampelina TaxID=1214573 RepID=A0A0G2FX57_9PEZI|nr:putative abi-domain-containing protein [Diaporthe ampelina]
MPSITKLLTDMLYKKEAEAPPPITTSTAVSLLVLYTLLYVAPFYLSPKTRPSPTLSRDAPHVIRARIASVTLTCAAASLTTLAVLTRVGGHGLGAALHELGCWPAGLGEALRALLLTALLFLGPLFESLVVEGGWRDWATLEPAKEVLRDITAWRNIVAVEILFRSASVPLMVLARTPLARTILVSPLVFGLAHVHHLYEFRVTHPGVPLAAALLRSLFQLGYTTLFGAYATLVFLRSGSLLAVFAVHVLCNCMGLPRVWGWVEGWDRGPGGGPVALGRGWSVAYYLLLVVGAVAWWRQLWALTESGNALVAM